MGRAGTKKQTKDPEAKIGIGKFWAWESREASDAAIVFLTGYVMIFCTDVMKLSALTVGTVLMMTKIIDGITDIIAGWIVDRTNTRFGKGRPYDFCLIGTWITFILMFAVPAGLPQGVRIAWIAIFYILSNAVFTTFLNAGENVFMLRAFNKKQIVRFAAVGGLATSVVGLMIGIIVPQMVAKAADNQGAWIHMVVVIGVPLAIIGMARFIFVREKPEITEKEQTEQSEKVSLKEIAMMLVKNPNITVYFLIAIVANIASNMGMGIYYFKWILGDIGLQSIVAPFSALSVIALVILPKLMHRYTLKQILVGGLWMYVIASAIPFFFPTSMPVLIICYVVGLIGTVAGVYTNRIIFYDNAEYNEKVGLHRMEGTMGAVHGFMKRIGSAFGTFLSGVILEVIGYNASMTTLATKTYWGFRLSYVLIPVISGLIQIIMWHFYKLDKVAYKDIQPEKADAE